MGLLILIALVFFINGLIESHYKCEHGVDYTSGGYCYKCTYEEIRKHREEGYKLMKRQYEIDTASEYFSEPEDYLKFLLSEELIIVNNGWWNKDWPKDKITLSVICNDLFYWGCGDCEDIEYNDLEVLAKAHAKDERWGIAAWCIKKRKQMPRPPVAKMMVEAGYNLEELIS
jgi:hypothetical protein